MIEGKKSEKCCFHGNPRVSKQGMEPFKLLFFPFPPGGEKQTNTHTHTLQKTAMSEVNVYISEAVSPVANGNTLETTDEQSEWNTSKRTKGPLEETGSLQGL